MTALHAHLIASGWSIEYADSDAIGSGSAGAPAWDKTPATVSDAGFAVYQMPANDHTTEWYVRIRPAWGAATTRVYVAGVTIGDTHDGSGGVTGGASEVAVAATGSNTDGYAWGISACEDGFALAMAGSGSTTVLVERLRELDGTVTDDLVALLTVTQLKCAHVRAGVGLVTSQPPIVLGALGPSGVLTFGTGNTIVNGDGDEVPIVGPFWPKGDPFYGPPRTAFLGSATDYATSTSYEREVDGGGKTYLSLGSVYSANHSIVMLATE